MCIYIYCILQINIVHIYICTMCTIVTLHIILAYILYLLYLYCIYCISYGYYTIKNSICFYILHILCTLIYCALYIQEKYVQEKIQERKSGSRWLYFGAVDGHGVSDVFLSVFPPTTAPSWCGLWGVGELEGGCQWLYSIYSNK